MIASGENNCTQGAVPATTLWNPHAENELILHEHSAHYYNETVVTIEVEVGESQSPSDHAVEIAELENNNDNQNNVIVIQNSTLSGSTILPDEYRSPLWQYMEKMYYVGMTPFKPGGKSYNLCQKVINRSKSAKT